MSEENVEIVRRIYEERLLEQHSEQLATLLTPDVEYVNPADAVEPGVRRGTDSVAHAFNVSNHFDSGRFELHELFNDAHTVIASVSFYARIGGSDAEIVQEEAHTWTLRSGRVVRFEWGRDLAAALEAAGLSE